MESHGISDESIHDPVEDPPTVEGERDSTGGSHRTGHLCIKCGSFLEHGCCSSVVVAPAGHDDDDPDDLSPSSSPRYWHKGKRTRRDGKPNCTSPRTHSFTEEEELANCLVMLSSARVKPVLHITDVEKPSTSGTKEENDEILVSTLTPPISRDMFECKGCKKVFSSHQALGGHRASHKKVKGCFAARPESEAPDADNQIMPSSEKTPLSIVPLAKRSPLRLPKNKSKLHECSVCHRLFPTGQALGGHKRCHWTTSKTNKSGAAASTRLQVGGNSSGEHVMLPQMFNHSDHTLDLNEQAPADDLTGIPLLLDVPAMIYLQSGWSVENMTKKEDKCRTTGDNLDDEAQSKEVKVEELSHLKDMDEGDESSMWLRIGI